MTGPSLSILLIELPDTQFASDMNKIFILSLLISFAMICSCQKQNSTAEVQLAQQKAALDTRENAFNERMNALEEKMNSLDEKVKALAEKKQDISSAQTSATAVQDETPDPAQVQAEKEKIIQQLSPQMRAMAPNDSKRIAQDPSAQRQPAQQESQNQQQYKLLQAQKKWMSGGAVLPSAEASSPTPASAAEATLPTPSPTPQ